MKISVAVITYNHELYIEQALLSVIAQYNGSGKLYDLEIIVADDASKDNTLNIIKKIQHDFSDIDIKILETEKNLGMHDNLKRCLEATTGDYVAILEGDDYYLSPFKLLKQMEFLEKNKDCVMCSHSYLEYNMNTDKFHTIDYQQNFKGDKYSFEELVVEYKWSNFSTYMYRKQYIHNIPDYVWELKAADYSFNMHMATHGSLGVIKEPLSVYRAGIGQWSSLSAVQQQKATLDFAYVSKEHFHKYFNGKYDAVFDKRIAKSLKNLKRVKAKSIKNKIRKIFGLRQK